MYLYPSHYVPLPISLCTFTHLTMYLYPTQHVPLPISLCTFIHLNMYSTFAYLNMYLSQDVPLPPNLSMYLSTCTDHLYRASNQCYPHGACQLSRRGCSPDREAAAVWGSGYEGHTTSPS